MSVLPLDVLAVTPSARCGLPAHEEQLHRIFGCEVLQETGILLELPQVVMVTAQAILHRFYYRQSLTRFDAYAVAMGSLLLASKLEEQPKMVRDIVFVFYYVYHTRRQTPRPKTLDIGGQIYSRWKLEVVNMERLILRELGFCLYRIMEHPHKFILYFVRLLGGNAELAQISWNYLNDSMRLDLCTRYPAKLLAATAIYIAARKLGHALPNHNECPWFAIMGADLETIQVVANAILALYHMPRLSWVEPLVPCDFLTDV